MKCAVIIGTRPEIIKMSPIIRALQKEKHFVIYSGQHPLSQTINFFYELGLPRPKYELTWAKSGKLDQFLRELGQILHIERPSIVLTHGDTYTTLFGSLAATKRNIPLGHVEAGLRCYDIQLPEEINRIAVDHKAQFLFAPTQQDKSNLLREGIERGVHVFGNTVVDAMRQFEKLAKVKRIQAPSEFFLLTLHRRENVDNPLQLKRILETLEHIYMAFRIPFVFPVHPRTQRRISEFDLTGIIRSEAFLPLEPTGFLESLSHQFHARLVLTDSGGMQEEACILQVPCITLRRSTERQATLRIGSNILAKPSQLSRLKDYVKQALHKNPNWDQPFGDGNAAEQIVTFLRENIT